MNPITWWESCSLVVIKKEEEEEVGFLLIDQLTCGLQMTGRGACQEECLCYFPSREEINFLWFLSETLPVGAGVGSIGGSRRARNRRSESVDVMMSALRFWCVRCSEESVSKRLGEDGLALKRFGEGSELQCGRPVPPSEPSSLSPRTYCVVTWCSCWRAMKNSHQLALNACSNFSAMESIFDVYSQTFS